MRAALIAIVASLLCQLSAFSEVNKWHVTFYQHPDKGGLSVSLKPTIDGTAAVPIDEFEKYHLQDEITEIHYCLPVGTAAVCFTGRFFKKTDGDIANFVDGAQILKDLAAKGGVHFGKDALVLAGTGKEEVAPLHKLDGGKYDDRIRSAKLMPVHQ